MFASFRLAVDAGPTGGSLPPGSLPRQYLPGDIRASLTTARVEHAVVGPELTLAALVLAGVWGCAPAILSPVDPQHQLAVEALGDEDPRVPTGPLHRPGQPCMVCHDVGDPAKTFTIAGTVFRDNVSTTPLTDADILFVDSAGNRFTSHTNCAGNFYVGLGQFEPVWPFWVTIRQGANDSPMGSPVHRDRSCAACHFNPAGPRTAGQAYLTSDDFVVPMIPVRACRPDEGNI